MRILNISLEKKLFEDGSAPQKRVAEYSRLFDRFDLVVMTGRGYKSLGFERMEIWPTNSFGRFCYLLDAYLLAKKMIEKNAPDAVSVQEPFETGILGWLLARKFRLKLQVQIHGDFFGSRYWRRESFLNRVRYYVGRFIVKRADSIRVVSQRIKSSLTKMGVNEEKIFVLPIFSENVGLTEKKEKETGDKFIFLTVNRLEKVKNIESQIEAMREVIKIYPQTELQIVGDGSLRQALETRIKNLGLENSIKLYGWQSDLKEFYREADVYLQTSNYEGWGLSVIDAAKFGLPILTTDVGCAGELIKDRESGLIVPVGDKNKLVETMLGLIVDRDLRRRIGENALSAVRFLPNKEESLSLYKKTFRV